jgi:hypothetical protein
MDRVSGGQQQQQYQQHQQQQQPQSSQPTVAVSAVNYGRVSTVSCLNSERFFEAQFYLTTYGSPDLVTSFYMKHGFMNLACSYVLEHNVPAKVFIDTIFVPCLSEGCYVIRVLC